LSNKRGELNEYERRSNKKIVVRISEELAKDRLVYYAYDARGSDIDIEKFKNAIPPTIASLLKAEQLHAEKPKENEEPMARKRSMRRGRRKLPLAEANSISAGGDLKLELDSLDKPSKKTVIKQDKTPKEDSPADSAMRVYQFAKSIGKTSKEIIVYCKEQGIDVRNHMSTMAEDVVTKLKENFEEKSEKKPRRKRRRRGGRRSKGPKTNASNDAVKNDSDALAVEEPKSPKKKRSGRFSKGRSRNTTKKQQTIETVEKKPEPEPKKKPRKTLYGGRRRSVTTDEIQASRESRG
jgi:hypothetical protein